MPDGSGSIESIWKAVRGYSTVQEYLGASPRRCPEVAPRTGSGNRTVRQIHSQRSIRYRRALPSRGATSFTSVHPTSTRLPSRCFPLLSIWILNLLGLVATLLFSPTGFLFFPSPLSQSSQISPTLSFPTSPSLINHRPVGSGHRVP
ncbi:hypothetical protein P170DRAFT_288455 [Aspergillus steynii IBT 23096]|uniref:Uncharacterized protein n=1 Tax=Aspergillus steynii IBT 23096 TaxID=1392250 RepID=A0A2I2FVB6_9EURO|nr:uncharacterized protein P170DRAFT_288455 [Aspergillus steynii IBT 23096]PLB44575.1 hypothetical protein P170DRAFT_288455 [Aspergillus steynii IBT 23096]